MKKSVDVNKPSGKTTTNGDFDIERTQPMAVELKKAAAHEAAVDPLDQKVKNLQAKLDRLSKLPADRPDVKASIQRTKAHLSNVQKRKSS
jgi:hypothetical protein